MACAKVLKQSNDKLGLITLNSIFVESKKRENRCITAGHECKAKNAEGCTLDSEERAMAKLFQLAVEGGIKVLVIRILLILHVCERTVS